MFLRVNQGQAFSTDEKLRAHNTTIAKLVRKLTDDYSEVSAVLINQSPAHRFRFIAEILCHLRNGTTTFNHSATELERFICEKDEYPSILLDHAKRALSILITKMADETFVTVLNMHPITNNKCHATRIELLVFSYYVCLGITEDGMAALANDFRHLRTRIRQGPSGRADMSKANWAVGMEWCQEMIQEKERLRQIADQQRLEQQRNSRQNRQALNLFDESEIDELKSENDNESDADYDPPTLQLNRGEGIGRGGRRPTARRGRGRAPRPE
jgi:hypothetical protein